MKTLLSCLCLLLLLGGCKRPEGGQELTTGAPEPAPTTAERGAPSPGRTGDVLPAAIPRLDVSTLDGKRYTLAGRRGRWVVVNFWATWCAPCLEEMPELSALDAMHEHIEVVGLAYEDIAGPEMKAFLDKHPVVYPVAILDVYDPPADFATPRGLPMTYLIAPDGRVARQFLGPVTAREIEDAIAAAGGPALQPLVRGGIPAAPQPDTE